MTEKLLQFIWQYKLFDTTKVICTTQHEPVEILHVGKLNTNAGPDFENSKIKINETIWVGNTELHVLASDWLKHKHSLQAAYNKVIAHVVYEADMEIKDNLGNIIPCIELKNAIDTKLLTAYDQLLQTTQPIACHNKILHVKEIVRMQQWDKMVIERLLQKSEVIAELLAQSNNNWSEVFYLQVAKVYGGNINGDAFMALATRLPLKILSKHKNNLLQLEALLFGVAGLIPQEAEAGSYEAQLQDEFNFLQKKYSLQVMDITRWKFMRMRPTNFPTIRIAQFAHLIKQSSFLFSAIIEKHLLLTELMKLFACHASEYWNTHYTFYGEAHESVIKHMGAMQTHNILINAVAPTLYVYGKQIDSAVHANQALQLLQELPPETNSITKLFKAMQMPNDNAYSSQAYIQQFKLYCTPKACLKCSVGYSILKG